MNDEETDDHRHAHKMENPCRLESAQQRDQTGELDGLPDRDSSDHLSDTGEDHARLAAHHILTHGSW
jgi:hypothetical protein